MKAVGIVGYKDSGKTTLTAALATTLEARGHRVAIAKFTHHGLDKAGTDTGIFSGPGRTVVGIGPEEAALFWGEKKYLTDLLPLVRPADFLLVEGGKELTWLPRVLCLKSASEADSLDHGLALATYGSVAAPYLKSFREETLDKLAAMLEERAFMLPGLDCGTCGGADCADLARRIVQGEASMADCQSVDNGGGFSVTVNGSPIALNPFVERFVRSGVTAMLSELKGYAPGDVVISFKS